MFQSDQTTFSLEYIYLAFVQPQQVANLSAPMGGETSQFPGVDRTVPIFVTCLLLKTRPPRPVTPFNNIVRAFPAPVWVCIVVSVGAFAAVFYLFHTVSFSHTATVRR